MDKKQTSWAKQAGVTPGKLVLIGVLAVVLASVLYLQYGPAERPAPAAVPSARPATQTAASANRTASSAAPVTAPAAERRKTGNVTNWSSPGLKTIVAYDPFALPKAFPKPKTAEEDAQAQQAAAATQDESAKLAEIAAERARSEAELQGLKQQAVKVIITRENEYVAIVGDQVVRVGDEVNGFKVIAIDGNGVRVAKDLTP